MKTKILCLCLLLVFLLACGIMRLPKTEPVARFDYHFVLTPVMLATPAPTVTPFATLTGGKAHMEP